MEISASVDKSEAVESAKAPYISVTDRYYTSRYCTDANGRPGEDIRILFHNNGICVVLLSLSHPIFSEKKTISGVNFQVTENVNRTENKPSGKGKKGGQWMTETSPLCKITCTDRTIYTVFGCIRGKLVEVNSDLANDFQRLQNKSQTEGYIGIILPRLGHSKPQLNSLLTTEQYLEVLEKRQRHSTAATVTAVTTDADDVICSDRQRSSAVTSSSSSSS